jgi:hypothetical protein
MNGTKSERKHEKSDKGIVSFKLNSLVFNNIQPPPSYLPRDCYLIDMVRSNRNCGFNSYVE